MTNAEKEKNLSLTNIVSTAIQVPGVKVDRNSFLRDQFKDADPNLIARIIKEGPIAAQITREELKKKAKKLINERTIFSTSASFVAGLPGGLAMAASIPADMLQFYGVALRLAQELAYLYGEPSFWEGEEIDDDKVKNQLILYCGVMLGATGAAQTVRVLSSALAKQAMKKIPQQALTKTFYYPIIKSIVKFFGGNMTKQVFGKGVSKVIPVVGGVVSGGITFATMKPMGARLAATLDEAYFDYTEDEFNEDWNDIVEVINSEEIVEVEEQASDVVTKENKVGKDEIISKIKEAKELLDSGIIDEDEFKAIKAKLISNM